MAAARQPRLGSMMIQQSTTPSSTTSNSTRQPKKKTSAPISVSPRHRRVFSSSYNPNWECAVPIIESAAMLQQSFLKSQSIPISSKHILRTDSEIQLCLDEQMADQRDYAFYSRVVQGMMMTQTTPAATTTTAKRPETASPSRQKSLQVENQMCLSHIMQTRREAVPFIIGQQQQQPLEEAQEEHDGWMIGVGVSSPTVHSVFASDNSSFEDGIFELDM